MDEIKIYDDFLNKLEIKFIEEIINNNKWEFGHFSSEPNNYYSIFWYMELINNEVLYNFIKGKIEENLKKQISIYRLYANGQTFGLNGGYHTDTDEQDNNLFTLCIYINDIPNDIIMYVGGEIQIKIPKKKYSISIEPLNGRCIMFPSNYTHKGTAFERFFTSLRVCIACKFRILE